MTAPLTLAIVDAGSGNLASVSRAFARAAEAAGIAATPLVTTSPDIVARAHRIVLPGQGAFAACASGLRRIDGLEQALNQATDAGTPFLGICVGMQLMAQRGREHGETRGLGWIAGEAAPIAAPGLPLPHMGWNSLAFEPGAHPLLAGIAPGTDVYFVHSYALTGAPALATTDYGGPITAMVAQANRAGTQFHVEKSQAAGLRLLANFLAWQP